MQIKNNKKIFFLGAIFLVALFFSFSKTVPAYAEIGSKIGVQVTGSEPLEFNNEILDPSLTDVNIRTHDIVKYRYSYATSGETGPGKSYVILTLPSNPSDIKTDDRVGTLLKWKNLAGYCQNKQKDLSNSLPVESSGISTNGQVMTCYLGNMDKPVNNGVITFEAQVSGDVKNNTEIVHSGVNGMVVDFIDGSGKKTRAGVDTSAVVKGVDDNSLPILIVKAKPRWKVEVLTSANGAYQAQRFVSGSGTIANPVDGVVSHYEIQIKVKESDIEEEGNDIRGVESIESAEITNILTGFPAGTRVLDWKAGRTNIEETDGCKGVDTSDVYISHGYNDIIDGDGPNLTNYYYSVADGGDCSLVESVNENEFKLVITGIDSSLDHFPSARYGTANPIYFGGNDKRNEYYVASKTIYLWTPASAFNDDPYSLTNTISSNISSISGQVNLSPDDDHLSSFKKVKDAGSFSLSHLNTNMVSTITNRIYDRFAMNNLSWTSDRLVDSISNDSNQNYIMRSSVMNNSTISLNDFVLCMKVDNSRQSVFDLGKFIYDEDNEGAETNTSLSKYRYEEGAIYKINWLAASNGQIPIDPSDLTIKFGVSSINTTWPKQDNSNNRYVSFVNNGSSQSNDKCEADIVWYDTLAGVPNLQEVRYIQVSKPASSSFVFEPNDRIFVFIGLRARDEFAFGVTDKWRDGTELVHAEGDQTASSFIPNSSFLSFDLEGVKKEISSYSYPILISPLNFPRIEQSSTSNPTNRGKVLNNQTVNYQLKNYIRTSSQKPINVIIKEVLPPGLRFREYSSDDYDFFEYPDTIPDGDVFSDAPGYTTLVFSKEVGVSKLNEEFELPIINFSADTQADLQNGSELRTSASIDTKVDGENSNNYPRCVYDAGNDTFIKDPADTSPGFCPYSNHTLFVDLAEGLQINKNADEVQIEVDDPLSYNLVYILNSSSSTEARFIDIVPKSGVNESAFTGTLALTTPKLTIGGFDPPSSDPTIFYYTNKNTTATSIIDPNPYSATHNLDGNGNNGGVNTNWCQVSQFNNPSFPNCPANIGQSTAFLVKADTINPRTVYNIKVNLASNSNVKDKYVNNFTFSNPALNASATNKFITSSNSTITVVSSSLSGFVYDDVDNDGKKEDGETGIENVDIRIESGSDTKTAKTNDTGVYYFTDLKLGTWKVTQVSKPAGYDDGKEEIGSPGCEQEGSCDTSTNDVISKIDIGKGVDSKGFNFGEIRQIGVTVKTNKLDGGVLTGVKVSLTGESTNFPQGTTDGADGSYLFSGANLHRGGTYVITADNNAIDGSDKYELDPAGTKTINGLDETKTVVIFTYKKVVPPVIPNSCFGSPAVPTVITDANGAYKFSELKAGKWEITETQPAGYHNGGAIPGVDATPIPLANKMPIEFELGKNYTGYNFYEYAKLENNFTFIADPNKINKGGKITLKWTVKNAKSCTASGSGDWSGDWSGSKSSSDGSHEQKDIIINGDSAFELRCVDNNYDSEVIIKTVSVEIFECKGLLPAYALSCGNKVEELDGDETVSLVDLCTDELKCEGYCESGYKKSDDGMSCEPLPAVTPDPKQFIGKMDELRITKGRARWPVGGFATDIWSTEYDKNF